jgi:hypothetical protein
VICKARPEEHRRAAISIHTLQRHSEEHLPQPTTPTSRFSYRYSPVTCCRRSATATLDLPAAQTRPMEIEALHMSYHFGENIAKHPIQTLGAGVVAHHPSAATSYYQQAPIFLKKTAMTVSSVLSLVSQTSPLAGKHTANDDVAWWVQRYLLDVSRGSLGGKNRLRSDWDTKCLQRFFRIGCACVRTSNDAIWGVWSGCGSREEEIYMRSPRTLRFDHSSSTRPFL